MTIMQGRYDHLVATLAGYQRTGISLIEFDGSAYMPTNNADDIGIYCLIPRLAVWFDLSLETAITTFLYGVLAIGIISGLIGFLMLSRSWVSRLVSCIGMVLLIRASICSVDVYIAYTAVVTFVVPLLLACVERNYWRRCIWPFFCGIGMAIGFVHYIRSYSGLAVLVFVVAVVAAQKSLSWRKKAALILVMIGGILVPVAYFSRLIAEHDRYVADVLHIDDSHNEKKHVMWHAIYVGFGFLGNNLGIGFDDHVAFAKVQSIVPGLPYPSPQSENILKAEVLQLARYHKMFVLMTIFAKIGVFLMYLFLYANIGLVCALWYRKPWWLDGAFALALVISSLFGILVVPFHNYVLGFIAFATMYGIYSIIYAINNGMLKAIRQHLNRATEWVGSGTKRYLDHISCL